MSSISAVIITYNEEHNISRCIESIRSVVDEIIVVDSFSNDRTMAICEQAKVSCYNRTFKGFADQKNYAISLAKGNYILSLDADEYLSPVLLHSIASLKATMHHKGYTMNRMSSYAGQWVRTCGWYPDVKLRLWQRGKGHWKGGGVHETLHLHGKHKTKHLKGDIFHHPYQKMDDFLTKIKRYSSIYSEDRAHHYFPSTFTIIYKTFFSFFGSYVLRLGFTDGYKGLLVSMGNANHTFYKYAKLRERNNSLCISLIISTYNREDALETTLMSVFHQSVMPAEVIIADDGSREMTALLVAKYQKIFPVPLIHCRHEDDGFRLAAIRNKAIRQSQGSYIILIDEDIVMHPHFIKSHRDNVRKNFFLQGSRVLLNEKATSNMIKYKYKTLSFFSRGIINRFNAIYAPFLSKIISLSGRNPSHARGANVSFWKEDLLQVNGFNEDFKGWGREDSELVARLYNAEKTCKYLKFGGFGYHLYHTTRSRENLSRNDAILQQAINNKLITCTNGINKI